MEKKSILIGIPIDAALNPERTGVGEYTFQLVSHFLDVARADPRYRFIFYSSFPEKKIREVFSSIEPTATMASVPHKLFWSQRVLPGLVEDTKPDVFFSPSNFLPLHFAHLHIPSVATIHGMEWYNFPEHYSLAERLYFRFLAERTLAHAQGIIAVSTHTKKSIENFSSHPLPPIAVIPHGVEIPARMQAKANEKQKKWRILFIGRKDRRKNLPGMMKALRIVERIASDVAFTFSAIGPLGNGEPMPDSRTLNKRNASIEMVNRFVSEVEKKHHHQKADIFLFPSYDEGFGIPILEAQAQGVPVVCSSFLKEIAQDGALYCDPNNPETIAAALLTLMLHPSIYAALRKNARANAKRFSWDTTARDTLAFLESIATGHG